MRRDENNKSLRIKISRSPYYLPEVWRFNKLNTKMYVLTDFIMSNRIIPVSVFDCYISQSITYIFTLSINKMYM